MLYELYTGDLLFQTHDSYQHLALIIARLEKRIPLSMAINSDKKHFFYVETTKEEHIANDNAVEPRPEDTTDTKVP